MNRSLVQVRQALPMPAIRTLPRYALLRLLGSERYARFRRATRELASQIHAQSVRKSERPSYHYGVWLRHVGAAHDQGLPCEPATVCEIGPGATVGAGLAALVSGSNRYIAVDDTWAWDTQKNVEVFDALVAMFRRRAPRASCGEFPSRVLTHDRLECALDPTRLRRIRDSIARVNRDDSCIRYIVQKNGDPMHELDGSVDMVFSHAVLEHVGELSLAYERMSRWLVPGGFMSHQIDFRSHRSARDWNGHWAYSDLVWKLIYLGTEPLINRLPCSEHIRLMRLHGFELVTERRRQDESRITRSMLAPRFRDMNANDLTTSGVFIQATRSDTGP